LGPSVALNSKRYVAPNAATGSRGVNVHCASLVDKKGVPMQVHPETEKKSAYYDEDGRWMPPDFALDKGVVHVCHNPSILNIMRAPLPRKLHGAIQPHDSLLRMFWDTEKDRHPALIRAQARGLTTFEQNRETVLPLFLAMSSDVDAEQSSIANLVLGANMLQSDSLDKTVAEEQEIERRAYGKRSIEKHGDVWSLEPRQELKDLSQEQRKIHDMISRWDKNERDEIAKRGYDAREGGEPFDVGAAVEARRTRHNEATDACVRLGLQRFEAAYASKKKRSSIPPGWYDVCHKGLREALVNAQNIGLDRSKRGEGRAVNPSNTDAKLGTANLGFAHGQRLIARDLSPWGHWRAFLIHLFSAGVRIAGHDVGLMLECFLHAFEP